MSINKILTCPKCKVENSCWFDETNSNGEFYICSLCDHKFNSDELEILNNVNEIKDDVKAAPVMEKVVNDGFITKDDLKLLINSINTIAKNTSKAFNSKKTVNGFDINQELEPATFTNPKYSTEIRFKSRSNTDYEVIKKDLLNLGVVSDFVEIFQKGLNPVVDKAAPVYGVGKKLEPLNQSINRAKASIDEATDKLNKHKLKQQEAIIKAKVEAEQAAQAAAAKASEPKGE